jgi:molybdopterin-guanine dinucleotide biosynthesis protein A
MLTGLILADGPNQRLGGKLKALLPFAGDTLIQNQIREMNKICDELIVVTQEPKSFYRIVDLNVRIITDYFPDKGPLSSLHAGFSLAQYPEIWVVSSEMPFLSARAAGLLWKRKRDGFDAVIPIVNEVAYPFHGIYDQSCAAKAFALLSKGEASVEALLKEIQWSEFSGKTLEENGIDLRFLFRIDTHEEYNEAILQDRLYK